jgi:Uma2 family endonuclease
MSNPMPSVTHPPPLPAPGQTVRLEDVAWEDYVAMVDAIPEGAPVRTAYHGGRLEIMTTSPEHEKFAEILGHLIAMLSLHTGIDIVSGGSTTFRSELTKRGVEPDKCYWIANAAAAIGLKRWNAETDPPPDLAIEIDITSNSINRRPIYASLGIAELWRFDGQTLQSFALNKGGDYIPTGRSLAFDFLNVADLLPFLAKLGTRSDTAILREFQEWCEMLATGAD